MLLHEEEKRRNKQQDYMNKFEVFFYAQTQQIKMNLKKGRAAQYSTLIEKNENRRRKEEKIKM